MGEQKKRTVIHRWADVPAFASEDEEAAWWPTVDFGDDFVRSGTAVPADRLPPKRAESVTVHHQTGRTA
jgi:hypothetical protein